MAGLKHPHRYKRHKYSTGTEIYFCTLPNCSHRIDPVLTLGKESICNRCGGKFIMNEYSIRLAKPNCPKCYIPKDKAKLDEAKEFAFTLDIDKVAKNGLPSLQDRLLSAIGSAEDRSSNSELANETDEELL